MSLFYTCYAPNHQEAVMEYEPGFPIGPVGPVVPPAAATKTPS